MKVFHHEPHDPKSNRVMNPVAFALFIVAGIVAAGLLLSPRAHADQFGDPVYGPSAGSDSFVPGSLKCYGTQNKTTGEWSLTIEGDWASLRKADFGLYYYGTSDPESNQDVSTALGPVIDSHYHVTLDGTEGELSQPVSRVLPTDGKPRHLKFELDGLNPSQVFTLGGVWEDKVSQVGTDTMFPVVTMRATDKGLCNPYLTQQV